MSTGSGDSGLGGIGLVGADIVVLKGRQNGLHTGIDLGRIVAGTVTREEKLQDESRHVGAFLDPVEQVLADHLAVKDVVEFLVELIHRAIPYSPFRGEGCYMPPACSG